jgi:hypothetical protein
MSSVYFEAQEATVMKLLDENFGVLKVNEKLVLFDTCDVWLDPVTTVDKVTIKTVISFKFKKKKLYNIV